MNLLCKAKRKDNGEWIRGFYVSLLDRIYNLDSMSYAEIQPETVCWFSGAEDDNDVLIFENDSVRIDGEWTGHVAWSDQDAAFIIVPDDDGRDAVYVGFCAYEKRIEVIGNIFDLDERGM